MKSSKKRDSVHEKMYHQHWSETEEYVHSNGEYFYHDKVPCLIMNPVCQCDISNYYGMSPEALLEQQRVAGEEAYKSTKDIVKAFHWKPSYWSPAEKAFLENQNKKDRDFLVAHHNEPVETEDGTKYADFAIPNYFGKGRGIIIEIDEVHHLRKMNKIDDAVRQRQLENEGWVLCRVPQWRLHTTLKEMGIDIESESPDKN